MNPPVRFTTFHPLKNTGFYREAVEADLLSYKFLLVGQAAYLYSQKTVVALSGKVLVIIIMLLVNFVLITGNMKTGLLSLTKRLLIRVKFMSGQLFIYLFIYFCQNIIYEVCSKNKVDFQILRATYIQFSIFCFVLFCYVGTYVQNIC